MKNLLQFFSVKLSEIQQKINFIFDALKLISFFQSINLIFIYRNIKRRVKILSLEIFLSKKVNVRF